MLTNRGGPSRPQLRKARPTVATRRSSLIGPLIAWFAAPRARRCAGFRVWSRAQGAPDRAARWPRSSASQRTLRAGWFSRDQPVPFGGAVDQVLQLPGHGGAVRRGRKECARLDTPFLPWLPQPRGPASVAHAGLRFRQFPTHAGLALGGGTLFAHHTSGEGDRIDAKVGRHRRCFAFHMVEVAIPKTPACRYPASLIDAPRPAPSPP